MVYVLQGSLDVILHGRSCARFQVLVRHKHVLRKIRPADIHPSDVLGLIEVIPSVHRLVIVASKEVLGFHRLARQGQLLGAKKLEPQKST